ncbi:hypothetical protein ACA910_002483 [Epithemia clementina (nom. ined.)]
MTTKAITANEEADSQNARILISGEERKNDKQAMKPVSTLKQRPSPYNRYIYESWLPSQKNYGFGTMKRTREKGGPQYYLVYGGEEKNDKPRPNRGSHSKKRVSPYWYGFCTLETAPTKGRPLSFDCTLKKNRR